ncbi:MAG: pyridoxal phosphate-dependent aminotransferase [Acidobacteriota bacterium]|nr:pyridoxal phosphate-dependent aminotransferase [Acidobacteriota bacterium]
MIKRSRRVPNDLTPNAFTEARARLGDIPFDLTISNPTLVDFASPPDLLEILRDPSGLIYRPDPRGPWSSREAVAAEYRRWSVPVDPDRVTLTASTSEAYSFLFRLLCDPGEAVFVPSPSYPLFDHLARLDAVEVLTYDLERDGGWRFDFSSLEKAPEQVRAVVVVHPNNPTGSFVHPSDRDRLVALCRDRGWALVADEVFLPYPLDGGPGDDRSFAEVEDCLCFSLGGLSKSIGLPQLKLAWIVTSGPEDEVRTALEGLEYVADAYLSVSGPIALAAPKLLAAGELVRREISSRCRLNLETLRRIAEREPSVGVLPVGGGWSATLRIPLLTREEDFFVRLLTECGVAIYPGYFFDFPNGGFAVASLLPTTSCFEDGVGRIMDFVRQTVDETAQPIE